MQSIATSPRKLELRPNSPNRDYLTDCADYLEAVRTMDAQAKRYADVIESLPMRPLTHV